MVQALIFDCFGVLIGRGFEETYRLAGGDPECDRQFIDGMLGQANLGQISDSRFRQAMAEHIGVELEQYNAAVRRAEQPNMELLTYIAELRASYKTAVLSNVGKDVIESRIGEEWAKQCFDVLVASGDVGVAKPDPEAYLVTAERLMAEPESCVFIDDKADFCEAARSVGMQAIWYRDFEQMKGELETLLAN